MFTFSRVEIYYDHLRVRKLAGPTVWDRLKTVTDLQNIQDTSPTGPAAHSIIGIYTNNIKVVKQELVYVWNKVHTQ